MDWYARRWNHFWFEPAPPTRLACCRVAFFGLTFLLYFGHDFSLWGTLSDVWWRPLSTFAALRLPSATPQFLWLVQTIWKASLLMAAMGLFTRLSAAVAAVGGFYLIGLEQCFGKIHHDPAVFVFFFLFLMCSRCGDALSIDAAFGRPRGEPSGEYTWPIRLCWLTLSIIYFAAGLSKLKTSGLSWIFSENLSLTMIAHYYPIGSSFPVTRLGLYLGQSVWVCKLLAALTLIVELGYPLSMFSRTARWALVPSALVMHLVIMATVGPRFWSFMIASVFWVPWDRVAAALGIPLELSAGRVTGDAPLTLGR